MARLTLVSACLLATIVAGAMPGNALVPAEVANVASYGPACTDSDDDKGTGGSHVSCYYSCAKSTLLSIAVHASDKDATTYGHTECGREIANCNLPAPTCQGTSDGLTTSAQQKAKCSGSSDEFWDSPVTVACSSTGSAGLLCLVDPDLCEGNVPDPDTDVDATMLARVTCKAQALVIGTIQDAPAMIDYLLAAVEPLGLASGGSFVAFVLGGAQPTALSFDADTQTCVLERIDLGEHQ